MEVGLGHPWRADHQLGGSEGPRRSGDRRRPAAIQCDNRSERQFNQHSRSSSPAVDDQLGSPGAFRNHLQLHCARHSHEGKSVTASGNDAYANTKSHSHGYRDAYSDTDTNRYSNANAHRHAHSNIHAYSVTPTPTAISFVVYRL